MFGLCKTCTNNSICASVNYLQGCKGYTQEIKENNTMESTKTCKMCTRFRTCPKPNCICPDFNPLVQDTRCLGPREISELESAKPSAKFFRYWQARLIISELHKTKSVMIDVTKNFEIQKDADKWLHMREIDGLNLGLNKPQYHYSFKNEIIEIEYMGNSGL
jgi:hypothetical protein